MPLNQIFKDEIQRWYNSLTRDQKATFKVQWGANVYSAEQIVSEVMNETEVGIALARYLLRLRIQKELR